MSQYVAIGVTGLLLWVRAFFQPPPMPGPEGIVPLYSLLYDWLPGIPVIAVILGFLLTAASAYLFNAILTDNDILVKNSSLGGFIYIAIASYYPDFLTLHPVGITLFILLLILRALFASYKRNEFLDLTYAAGFLLAIGSFFYQPFLLFVFLLPVSLILFRSSDWRAYISMALGLLTPYLFLAVFYFWFDRLIQEAFRLVDSFTPGFRFEYISNPVYLALTSLFSLLVMAGLVARWGRFKEKTIEIRSKAYQLNWLVLFTLASAPFASATVSFHFLLMVIPLSMLLSAYFLRLRRSFWQELAFLVLLVFLILHNNLWNIL